MMKARSVVLVAVLALVAGCGGGGGGGGSDTFYGGIWDYSSTKVLDECGTTLSTFATVLTVNQDGDNIVVNSGQATLTGTVEEDKDGFTVTGPGPTTNNCATAGAYVFRDASDGDASVGLGLAVRCGSQQCAVGFGGRALRRGGKALAGDTMQLDEALKSLAAECSSGTTAKTAEIESEIDLEALAAEAAEQSA